MMRKEIRRLLVENVLEVNSRVYEPSAAGPKLEKPFIVLREGVQNPGEDYADCTTVYEVWPYVDRTTFQNVDSLSKAVKSTLNRKRFDVSGIPHFIQYDGDVSEDIVDTEWNVLTRGLRFRIYSLAWLSHTPIDPDPVETLQCWTAKRFAGLQTDPALWNPQDDAPALYWRQSSILSVQPMNWGTWMSVRLNGHIITPDLSLRKEWTERIVRQLALDRKTLMPDGSRLGFENVSADSGYNPFSQGQISLDVRFGILEEKMQYQTLKHIDAGSIYGGVELGK